MTEVRWQIPPSVLRLLERAPNDRAIAVLLRHSVRDHLPPGDAGYVLPITEVGRQLALELGGLLRCRLRTLHASPLLRCVQTAQALAEGAGISLPVVHNRLLGDPGVFVLDDRRAWENWERLGHEGVMAHLVSETAALPGMARPHQAARFLVQSMLAGAANRPGVHVFVTHDSLVTATAAQLLGRPLVIDDWPWYLEGAFFWSTGDHIHTAYKDEVASRPAPLCGLAEDDVAEFARREIAATVGLDSGARFFLAGGAFKSLLTGRPPRDLDVWAPSDRDRDLLLTALRDRGARPVGASPFADAFEVAGRVVEVPYKTEPNTLAERLARFDIGLSAVGVEHRPNGEWCVMVHPLAHESIRSCEVRLLKPLVNRKYVLTTLERMRRYAKELAYTVPAEEEAEVWRVFEEQDPELRAESVERYREAGGGDRDIMQEIARRFPDAHVDLAGYLQDT